MNIRKLSLLLAFLIITQIAPFMQYEIVSAGAYTTATAYYDGSYSTRSFSASEWSQVQLDYNIRLNVKKQNIKGMPFNIELWLEKGITVYGDYSLISSAKNDFKNATGDLDAEGKYIETQNKGYYKSGTGEYRYHGYDYNNNLYTNGDFPIDGNSGMKATAKNWIYRIWDRTTPHFSESRISEASEYNKVASGEILYPNGVKENIQTWINDGLPFEITNSNNTNKDAFNYAQVLTAPTTRQTGEVQMYHLSYYDGKPWYQVFSLEQIKQKEITSVEAKIIKVDENRTEDGGIDYTFKITGKILDDDFYQDEVLKTTKYTREDIDSWAMELSGPGITDKMTLVGRRTAKDTGEAVFNVHVPYSEIEPFLSLDDSTFSPSYLGKATTIFNTGEKSSGTDNFGERIPFEIVEALSPVQINITAPNEMLDTEKFHIVDTTTGDDYVRSVTLEGVKLSDAEADKLLSGNHLFPLAGIDKLYTYTVNYYDAVKDVEYTYADYVLVYTTKPNVNATVTGTFKENRLITARPEIHSVNSDYLKANASISTTVFDATLGSENDSLLKFGTKNMDTMRFIVKGEDQVNITIQATSSPSRIERADIPANYFNSDPYTYQLYTLPDYEPAIVANIWNGTLTRKEALDFTYEAVSTDSDLISINTYKIEYDANGDGTYETLIKQDEWANYTEYKPSSLGMYKITFYAEETFGQPTLDAYITDEDKRFITVERTFNVDNLAPMTKLFTDIEYAFPQADVIVLNDEAISRELNNTIVSERVNWINGLRQSSVDASVQVWDLYTYVFSQSASTTRNTGSYYPSATTSYASNGYSGTLSRYQVVNNQYQQDDGYWKTVTDSISVSDSISQTGTAEYTYTGSSWYVSQSYGMSILPGSMSYSSGGYTGTLSKTGGGVVSDDGAPSGSGTAGEKYYRTTTWEAIYTGTASKQVQQWVSNWVWYDDYTGYYSGTLYKNVKQSYTPAFRMNSDKYLVYFADSNINHLEDIQAIKNKGTVKVILVGNDATKDVMVHDAFIDIAEGLEAAMTKINTLVANENPYENKQLVQIDETFTLHKADLDDEGDPLLDLGYQYVHDAAYYDNSMGLESDAVVTYSEEAFKPVLKSKLSKVGHYRIFRKIMDQPVGHERYSKESNVPQLDIYVHRKPIADFALNWDYDVHSSSYLTTWEDLSYDLDHQYSDTQKGIVDRKIMYRKTSGDNTWVYAIPNQLSAGTYELRYTVKDLEGAWSDEVSKTFVLSPEPPMRLYGKLKTLDAALGLSALPASEGLNVTDRLTQFHRAHTLGISLINSQNQIIQYNEIQSSDDLPLGSIEGNQYLWPDENMLTPATLKDGAYKIRVKATATQLPFTTEILDLPFQIVTPVSIKGEVGTVTIGEHATLKAITNKYITEASVTLFDGTAFKQTLSLSKVGALDSDKNQTWEVVYRVPEHVDEGEYVATFIGKTPSGKEATDQVGFKADAVAITDVTIEGYWNHWRGQVDAFGQIKSVEPHRFLGYEKVKIKATITGNPERVEVRFSPELEAMRYKNSLGQMYEFKSNFGYEIQFPLIMTQLDAQTYTIETILPLAKETLSWSNQRMGQPYAMTVTAVKGDIRKEFVISDLDMTGNIYEMLYVQPNY